MKSRSLPFPRRFIGSTLIALLTASSSMGDVTWGKYAAGTYGWNDGTNWLGGTVPGNPSADRIYFVHPGGTPTITVNLDIAASTQTLGQGLDVISNSGATNAGLVINLNAKTMILEGDLTLDARTSPTTRPPTLEFRSGTVQLGTADTQVDLVVGIEREGGNNYTDSTMKFGTGATLDTYNTRNLLISSDKLVGIAGGRRAKVYTLDLTAASLQSGDALKTFAVTEDVTIGLTSGTTGGNADFRPRSGTLKMGEVSTFSAGRDLVVGQLQKPNPGGNAANATNASGKIEFLLGTTEAITVNVGRDLRVGVGDYATGEIAQAPEVLHLNVGSAVTPTEERGVIYIGYKNQSQTLAGPDYDVSGSFVGGSANGSIHAYVRELRVGENTRPGGIATGKLDFRNVTETNLQISGDAVIGKGTNAEGALYLKDGVASSVNLTVGESTVGEGIEIERSILSLDNVSWTVSESLMVGALGEVYLSVGGENAGIDLTSSDPVNFTIQTGGFIAATFDLDADEEPMWAIRMQGDQQDLFQSFLADGRLLATGLHADNAGIYFDGSYTYYGYAIPEPSTFALLGIAGAAVAMVRRSRRVTFDA